jgi:trans-aconitate methyltransferase
VRPRTEPATEPIQRSIPRLGRPVRSAVDIGCGTGRLTPTIAAGAGHVLALDLTEELISAAPHGLRRPHRPGQVMTVPAPTSQWEPNTGDSGEAERP